MKPLNLSKQVSDPLASYVQGGNVAPVRDPSMIRQGVTYYLFSTDSHALAPGGYIPIRCSQDHQQWTICGDVFQQIPGWLKAELPGAVDLWAPDISYFAGRYHLYYAISTVGSQRSVIGLATNTTLEPSDPNYRWIDEGKIISSHSGDDFNAIDPNILIDGDGDVWLTYGSFWSGIKQRQIDPASGRLVGDAAVYSLATRPGVEGDPIEGAFLMRHGGYYYLFASVDFCCRADASTNNYKQVVGRGTAVHGPFVSLDGTPMMEGGGNILLSSELSWKAPGGGSVYTDPDTGESILTFHALNMDANGSAQLWVKQLNWQSDWPVIQ